MDVFCGIDWAEDHHDIALAGRDGQLLARRRIGDDAAGLAQLVELLAAHGDSAEDPIPVAIETPRGLLTACLRATGRAVYPINPMAVARYRDRHSGASSKANPPPMQKPITLILPVHRSSRDSQSRAPSMSSKVRPCPAAISRMMVHRQRTRLPQ